MNKHIPSLSLNTAVGTTPEISVVGAEKGSIHIPTGSTITTLTFHAAPVEGGTYQPQYTQANAAVTMTVAAARTYPLPPECFHGNRAMKIVANVVGAVDVTLRS